MRATELQDMGSEGPTVDAERGIGHQSSQDGDIFVECKPLQGDERTNAARDQLRCRFTKGSKAVDVPLIEDRPDGLLCKCSAEFWEGGATVCILLPNGEEITCEALPGADKVPGLVSAGDIYKRLSFLDRYLFIWIFGMMGLAILIGYYDHGIKKRLSVAKVASVSLPIAIGLWVMMYPVLCKVRYELLPQMLRAGRLGKNLAISLVLNWLIGPALMTGLAWATLPDLSDYRTGVIMVGIARCIAMVLIWNELAKGDAQLCAIIVAMNSVLQIALFTPVSLFYLKVVSSGSGVHVSAWTVAKSVLLFLGVPLVAGFFTRVLLRRSLGAKWYDTKFIPFIGPWALIGLLYTIFVMFAIQAHEIINNIGEVARVVVPLLLYFAITFSSAVFVCRYLSLPYPEIVTQSFTAASNNFELAIAVAVGAFGIDSHEALAATIGPLIEVPVLLILVYVTLYFKNFLSR